MDETTMQGVLMRWAMNDKHHVYALPNSNQLYYWEADLITVTSAQFVHEFEIKISIADYKRDCKKSKHFYVGTPTGPNYFWYATTFDIDPPEQWGWILVSYNERRHRYEVEVKKEAPRLHSAKLTQDRVNQICRMLSWRVTNLTKVRYDA